MYNILKALQDLGSDFIFGNLFETYIPNVDQGWRSIAMEAGRQSTLGPGIKGCLLAYSRSPVIQMVHVCGS